MRNKDGFTLLEVITGLAVIAIVSVSLLQMFLTSTRVGRKGFDVDQANMLAVKAIELFKLNPVGLGGSEMFDNGALGAHYTFTADTGALYRYFDFDWQPVEAEYTGDHGEPADYTFQLVASAAPDVSVDADSVTGLSYYPQLRDGIEITREVTGMPALSTVEVKTDTVSSISVSINGVKTIVPFSSFSSNVLPILISCKPSDPAIVFQVENTAYLNDADLEVGLFVFGDDKASPKVTLSPVNGLCSITYLTEGQCNYSNYKADIEIFRKDDSNAIVSMQGNGYVAYK